LILTISQTTPNPTQQYLGTVPVLRGYYSHRFVAGDEVTPVEQGNGLTGFFYEIPCSINIFGQLVIPAFEIQTTTDGNLPTSRFTARLFDQSGVPREIIFGGNSGWQIPTLFGSNVTWADLFRYNQAARLLNPPPTYFTAEQVIMEILALAGQFDYARVGHNGIAQPDVAPVVASEPIFVGVNSPLLSVGRPTATGVATLTSVAGESSAVVTGVSVTELDSPIDVFALDDNISGHLRAVQRIAGTGFTILSDNGLDTGSVAWFMYASI
jgi:hypothetical protein